MADRSVRVPLRTPDDEVCSFDKTEPNSQAARTPRQYRSLNRIFPTLVTILRQWWGELLACVLTLTMLLAIFGVLRYYQEKTIPHWPYRLSINTVIAIFASVLKASAILVLSEGLSQLKWLWVKERRPLMHFVNFDSASRGPLGSLQLLRTVKRENLIATTGAILIVISLAIDPFVQQLVRYHDCLQARDDLNATIPQAYLFSDSGPSADTGPLMMATPLYRYFVRGLLTPNATKINFVCPTGNCTFDGPYHTLGYTAICEDITDQLKILEATSNGSKLVKTTLSPEAAASSSPDVSQPQSWFVVDAALDGHGTVVVLAASSLPGSNDTFQNKHLISRISRGAQTTDSLALAGCDSEYANSTWACSESGAGAARCALKPAVKTYRARVTNGVLLEELLATRTDLVSVDSHLAMADLQCAGGHAAWKLRSLGYNVSSSTDLFPWNVTVELDGTRRGELSQVLHRNDSSLEGPGPDWINGDLADLVPSKCVMQMTTSPYKSVISYMLNEYLWGSLKPSFIDGSTIGTAQVQALFNNSYVSFDSVQAAFTSITDALTVHVRQYGDPTIPGLQREVRGTVWENTTCVSIRWGFFAFPIAIVALTIIFLVAVIVRMTLDPSGQVTAGWKSSPLPLILDGSVVSHSNSHSHSYSHSHGQDQNLNGGTVRSIAEMNKRAEESNLQIGEGEQSLAAVGYKRIDR